MIEHIVPSYSLDLLALILTAAGNLNFCESKPIDYAQVDMDDDKMVQ